MISQNPFTKLAVGQVRRMVVKPGAPGDHIHGRDIRVLDTNWKDQIATEPYAECEYLVTDWVHNDCYGSLAFFEANSVEVACDGHYPPREGDVWRSREGYWTFTGQLVNVFWRAKLNGDEHGYVGAGVPGASRTDLSSSSPPKTT